jgi:hypothetical protein
VTDPGVETSGQSLIDVIQRWEKRPARDDFCGKKPRDEKQKNDRSDEPQAKCDIF